MYLLWNSKPRDIWPSFLLSHRNMPSDLAIYTRADWSTVGGDMNIQLSFCLL